MPVPRPQGCPPADASPVDQTFFRFVSAGLAEGSVPPADDWLYPYEQPRSRAYFGQTEDCGCHAHSLIGDSEDVENFRALVPAFKKKCVATVAVASDHGVVKHTPRKGVESHHSWWPEPIDRWPQATVVVT